MNTELSPEITRTCSKGHGKIENNNRFPDLAEITVHDGNSIRLQCSEHEINMLQHGKTKHGMNLLKAYDKSPLLTISQKGSENMMAPM